MTDVNHSWTADRIETLRKLWADGVSASHIADRLGGVSRNAVIGKVHRLRLHVHPNALDADAPRKPPASRKKRQLVKPPKPKVKPLVGQAQFARKKPDPVKMAEVKKIEDRPPPSSMPSPLLVRLFELNHNDCRWPVQGEKSNTLFCGRNIEPGCSYCPEHKQMSVGAGTRSERLAIPARLRVA